MNADSGVASAAPPAQVTAPVDGGVAALRAEVAQLREAAQHRSGIEQAKGAVMLRYGTDADTAFRVLSRWSQYRNIRLRALADDLMRRISAGDGLATCTCGCLADLDDLLDAMQRPEARPAGA